MKQQGVWGLQAGFDKGYVNEIGGNELEKMAEEIGQTEDADIVCKGQFGGDGAEDGNGYQTIDVGIQQMAPAGTRAR